jgi:hypothetical protein
MLHSSRKARQEFRLRLYDRDLSALAALHAITFALVSHPAVSANTVSHAQTIGQVIAHDLARELGAAEWGTVLANMDHATVGLPQVIRNEI